MAISSFDDLVIPLRIQYASGAGPTFSTEVIIVDNGFERRNQNWSQARRRYDARSGLFQPKDVASLIQFFHARAGRARGFLLKDWNDFSSNFDGISPPAASDQIIGTGNGTQTQFQIVKNYNSAPQTSSVSHQRVIKKVLASSVLVSVNNVTLASTAWAVSASTGMITFKTAPANNSVIRAGFQFFVPVRFDTDSLSITTQNYTLSESVIPIVEIRV